MLLIYMHNLSKREIWQTILPIKLHLFLLIFSIINTYFFLALLLRLKS